MADTVNDLEKRQYVTINVVKCARCGQDHAQLRFERLLNPPSDISHWAACPVTGQPILLRFTEVDDG